ncbi:MAG: IclR family transcriptional regulator [Alcaligenaceae bacterium]|nr:IclR family transcriptional regulator [Alcaligenaceae bacterium]
MKNSETAGTQSIGRAASILRVIASAEGAGFGLGEIALQAGLEKPTTHRILRRLVEESMLVQDPASRSYHLGPLLYELGLAAQPSIPARQWCAESLAELARLSGDCAFLIGRSGYDSVCLDRHEGHFPIKTLVLGVGQRRPLGCGAGSIALLSLLPDDTLRTLLDHNAERLKARGEPPTADLLRTVQQARKRGFAIKDAPDLPVRTLSMPVVDHYGNGICALSITSLTPRIEQRQDMLADILRRITQDLSRRMRSSFTHESLLARYAV